MARFSLRRKTPANPPQPDDPQPPREFDPRRIVLLLMVVLVMWQTETIALLRLNHHELDWRAAIAAGIALGAEALLVLVTLLG